MSAALQHPLLDSAQFQGERREICERTLSDGVRTVLSIHLPSQPQERPVPNSATILLLPGWSGPRCGPADFLVQLSRALACQGHYAVRMDLMGRGDATGSFDACDLDAMIRHAGEVVEYLAEQARFPKNIAVGGICSGSNVALGLAALKPKLIQQLLAYSILPFQPARTKAFERRRRWKNLKQYARKAMKPGTWAKLLRGEIQMKKVKENLSGSEKKPDAPAAVLQSDASEICRNSKPDAGRNLKDSARDIEKELLDWKGRALLVWGQADEEAGLSERHFRQLHQNGFAGNAKFHTIAQASHNFYARSWRDELEVVTLDFLNSR